MGTELSKRKDGKKNVKSKNTPRNSDSIQSLNIYAYGSFSTNRGPNAYTRPEVTHTLTRAQSVASPTAVECRCKSQQAQKNAVPVQKENNECVPGSQQEPNTGHTYSGSTEQSPDLCPYCCHYEAKNKDDINLRKAYVMQLIHDEQTDKQIFNQGQVLQNICCPHAWSSLSIAGGRKVVVARDRPRRVSLASVFSPMASTEPSVEDHNTEGDGRYCVRNFTTGQEGRAPANCVEKITSIDVESQKYFFQLNKKEAEQILIEPEIESGTYLIRRSADRGPYVLSLRYENEIYEVDMMHYEIRVDDRGVCYIDDDSNIKIKPFSNITELITYYTEEPGLRCKLKTPLPRDIPLDDLAVKFSDFTLEEKLGYGNYGTVYAATLHGNKQVAVKSLKAGGSMTVAEFRGEAETMHKLRHPNLVSLLAICENHGSIFIITERMSRGSLLTLLREDTGKTIKFKDLIDMAIQVTEGMCYLEMKGFVHRDLRAANVLVGDGNVTKIADFGLARLLDNYYEHESFYQEKKGSAFPYKWTAPEAIKQQRFTIKSDVWSFGVLLYEMVTHGDEPYAAMSNHVVLDWVERGNRLKRPTDQHCPAMLYNIMRQCWLKNSDDRPNFADIKEIVIEFKTIA